VTFDPGYYVFYAESDDGVRFWLDDELLINEWHRMDRELHYQDGFYVEGTRELTVEYYEHTGHAGIRFWWERSGPGGITGGDQAIPVGGPAEDPWLVEFFDNQDLQGSPVLSRIDTALDYYWGLGAPAPGLPRDGFSVRWTQVLPFEEGQYRFTTTTDDGVRLWINGFLVIDAWRPMRGQRSATVWLEGGLHQVRMEYFERGGAAMARLTWRGVAGTGSGVPRIPCRAGAGGGTTGGWPRGLSPN
jgi:hypothetical protein